MNNQRVVGEVRKALTPDELARTLLAFRGQRNEIEEQLVRGVRTNMQVQLFIDHKPVPDDNARPSKHRLFVLRFEPIGTYACCLAKNEHELLEKFDIIDDEAVNEALDGIDGDRARERAMKKLTDSVIGQKESYYHYHAGETTERYQGWVSWVSFDISEEEAMVLQRFGLIKTRMFE